MGADGRDPRPARGDREPLAPGTAMRAEPRDESLRFADAAGTPWRVREIRPRLAERRLRQRRRATSMPAGAARSERRNIERRRAAAVRPRVRTGFERGWLTFESGDEKRRFAPIPPNWRRLPERELRKLLAMSDQT